MTTLVQKIVDFLDWTVNWFFAIVMLLSLLIIIYAALLFLTSGGDSQKVGQAKKWLLWALIGFTVAIFTKTLLTTICNLVGVATCPV